jgi:hypothetical protein
MFLHLGSSNKAQQGAFCALPTVHCTHATAVTVIVTPWLHQRLKVDCPYCAHELEIEYCQAAIELQVLSFVFSLFQWARSWLPASRCCRLQPTLRSGANSINHPLPTSSGRDLMIALLRLHSIHAHGSNAGSFRAGSPCPLSPAIGETASADAAKRRAFSPSLHVHALTLWTAHRRCAM